jgi:histidinol-phosphate phosphatase family protein
MRVPAVFFDKDGTLVEDVPYNVDPNRMWLTTRASEGLRTLNRAGYRLVVFTNQSGVARGYFREEALRPVEQHLRGMLRQIGVPLQGFYYCPHHPDGVVAQYAIQCSCRKPAPGMLLRAAHEQGLDLRRSWVIGDILNDIEAGRRAGCKTILLDNGNETEWLLSQERLPHWIVGNLAEAARVILAVDSGYVQSLDSISVLEREVA